ncbi:MAG: hypothetical protein WDO74_15310 [Pseudomonadota bacterium]
MSSAPEFRSLKAEIVFPVSTQLEPSAPFDHLLFNPQNDYVRWLPRG